MSTTSVPAPTSPLARVKRAGRSLRGILDEMATARAVGRGGPRR